MIKNATTTPQTALTALHSFVGRQPTDPRPYVNHAFSDGLHAYSTDGRALLSVPLQQLDTTIDLLPIDVNWQEPIRALRSVIGKALLFGGALVAIPPLPEPTLCKRCLGNGNVQEGQDCDECDGEGEFEHGGHWYDCKACDGTGKTEIFLSDESAPHTSCPDCYGLGEARNNPAPVGAAHIDRVFLARIAALPNARIATPMDATSTVYFTCDFGDGAVMPYRAPTPIRHKDN